MREKRRMQYERQVAKKKALLAKLHRNGCFVCGRRGNLVVHHIDPKLKTLEIHDNMTREKGVAHLRKELEVCVSLCEDSPGRGGCHHLADTGQIAKEQLWALKRGETVRIELPSLFAGIGDELWNYTPR